MTVDVNEIAFLEDHDIAFVCVDDNRGVPPVVAATADVAVVRFVGRRTALDDPDTPDWPGWPWPYRYSDDELASWVPSVAELASSSREVHALFANCWRDDAVDNALSLIRLLRSSAPAH